MLTQNGLPPEPVKLGQSILSAGQRDDAFGERSAMQDPAGSVLFVTDELFLPTPHNGSQNVYLKVAHEYAQERQQIFCLSFWRDRRQATDPEVCRSYTALFSGFYLMPSWNGGGTLIGTIALGLRELSRWTSGNRFSTGTLIKYLLRPHLAKVVEFVKQNNIGTIYFHKVDTMLLLEDILKELRPALFVLDLHDDFVRREEEYKVAYGSFFACVSMREILKNHLKFYLRFRGCRFNLAASRSVETRLLNECDRILINSCEEFFRYQERLRLAAKVVHHPLRMPAAAPRGSGEKRFHAGFVGSADVMNLDALLWFCSEILPRIRRRRSDFRFLVAGSIGAKARGLVDRHEEVTIWRSFAEAATFYDAIEVAVAPLRFGTGTCIKVLEALAFGCPMVTTSVGVRGLLPEDVIGSLVADDPETFATRVIESIR
jgi:glycosyltransferase involved in cell wall biosynthesis